MAEYDQNSKNLMTWPEDIPSDCETLALYANKIKKVPPSIGKLTKLVACCLPKSNHCLLSCAPTRVHTHARAP